MADRHGKTSTSRRDRLSESFACCMLVSFAQNGWRRNIPLLRPEIVVFSGCDKQLRCFGHGSVQKITRWQDQDIELLNLCGMVFTVGVEYNRGGRVLGPGYIVLSERIETAMDDDSPG